MALTAAVLGASGYSGAELVRILWGHVALDVVAASADSRAGEALGAVNPHLSAHRGVDLLPTAECTRAEVDVCFSCLPAGALGPHVEALRARIVVDLADDFRAAPTWSYGLTEFARDAVGKATRIANPGCFPTATLLCLVPFARAGLVEEPIVVDALSGVSGAGRKAEDRLLFAGVHGDFAAYGDIPHRHVSEMERGLHEFGGVDAGISFTPHLVPAARGVVVTARIRLRRGLNDGTARAVLDEAYAHEPFVDVVDGWPSAKAVAGSNRAHVGARVDTANGWLICAAAIDNLGKGAAGQAVQNANVALGITETTGLEGLGVWP